MVVGGTHPARDVEPGRESQRSRVPVFVSVVGVVLVALNLRMAVTGIPPILDRLGLGAAGQSVLVTIPVLAFSLGALAGPRLRAGFGEERAILAVVALLLCGLLTRAALGGPGLFVGTILAGLGIAVLNVLLPGFVKRRFSNRVGAMTATYTTVMTLGAATAAGLTVPVLDAAGGTIGVALAVWAVPAVLALVVWWPQLGVSMTAADASDTHQSSVWGRALAWQVMAFMGLQSMAFYGSLSWIPAIYHDHGVSPSHAGLLLLVMNLVSMGGNVVAPMVAARMRDQRPVIVVTVTLSAAAVCGLLVAPTAAPVLWMAVLGLGQGASISLALLLIVLRSADSDTAARLSSMAQSGGYLIAAAGPLVIGLVHAATGNWTLPLVFLLAVVFAQLTAGLGAGRNRLVGGDIQAVNRPQRGQPAKSPEGA